MRAPALLVLCAACHGAAQAPSDGATGGDAAMTDAAMSSGSLGPGFPATAPWVSFYGNATMMGDLAKVASTFRVINIDADPDAANFTAAQYATLRAGGQNRVISYLNLGSCEMFRGYWSAAPAGLQPCGANTAAQLGPYAGYPDEVWMNLGDANYQRLILEHVAPRLAAAGVDGFFLDNLELIEHGTATTNGPCDAACAQGGLDLVRKLREKFPSLLIVMQNATSDVTRLGSTGGLAFPLLLDGISHESPYFPSDDPQAQSELAAWRALGLSPGGRAFFLGTEDYVGDCANTTDAKTAYDKSRAAGSSPYATDKSAGQRVVCYWPF